MMESLRERERMERNVEILRESEKKIFDRESSSWNASFYKSDGEMNFGDKISQ